MTDMRRAEEEAKRGMRKGAPTWINKLVKQYQDISLPAISNDWN